VDETGLYFNSSVITRNSHYISAMYTECTINFTKMVSLEAVFHLSELYFNWMSGKSMC